MNSFLIFMKKINDRGYSLVEIVITIALGAVLISAISLSLFTFRNNVEYDILFNEIIESINNSKSLAVVSKLDSTDNRSSFSVKFMENKFVEFEGDIYLEGNESNVEHYIPIGFRLGSVCSPNDDGTVTFSPVSGESVQSCIVSIYKLEDAMPAGTLLIDRYGLEQAY